MTPVEPTYGINYLKQSRGFYLCSCLSNVLTVKHSHFKSLLHRLRQECLFDHYSNMQLQNACFRTLQKTSAYE